jgi:hypothetical protein
MMPPILSRTPEGMPNRCPLCGKKLRIEPSNPPGDAPCPNCGYLVWFNPQARLPEAGKTTKRFSLIYAAPVLAIVVLLLLEFQVTWGPYLILGILAILLFGKSLTHLGRWLRARSIKKRFWS